MDSSSPATAQKQWVCDALERYEGPLLRYTVRLLNGDLEAARDVVQDAFVRLIQQERSSVQGHLAPWLYRVCRNRALDRIRKEQRMQTSLPDAPDRNGRLGHASDDGAREEPGEQAQQPEARSRLLVMVADLPERQREVLRLKFQGDLSYREIAEIMDLTVSHVGVLIHTGIQTLRQRMTGSTDPKRSASIPNA
ncbi:MAG: sigma-70 family RNA polymerase sigma factor [Phycisphaerales bacterium]|nr:sigma-70 family RNA polymerase sigma factor [Phycisphaerales bacterium]